MTVYHKKNDRTGHPVVSIILLDWSCRERFHTLDWLDRQACDRDKYEIIWVELYDRTVEPAREKADVLITCSQTGMYHKHLGYNIGLLASRGRIIVICDSDAVFPPDFIDSILEAFDYQNTPELKPQILMHYQWRSPQQYPDDLTDIDHLSGYEWVDLWPNVGACMSVRKQDAITFGGFDEHESFRGYMCGPYDLGWRLVNAGLPEIWVDPAKTALWHFAHLDPTGTYVGSTPEMREEIVNEHIDGHALTAVEAFSTGRLLPLQENPDIFNLRMDQRLIGTPFEEKYARRPEFSREANSPSASADKAGWSRRLINLILGQRI